MPRYEYKVVPAPTKGLKGKGVKGPEARFSHALQELMNGLAGYGWEYQRAETLPSIERAGLTSTTTEWRNVLVFRRLRENDADAFAPELLPAPDATAPAAAALVLTPEDAAPAEPAADTPEPAAAEPASPLSAEDAPETEAIDTPTDAPKDLSAKDEQPETLDQSAGDEPEDPWDNGVEDTDDVKGVGTTLETLAAARSKSQTDA